MTGSVPVSDFTLDDLPDGRIFVAGTFRQGQGAEIESRFPADGSLNRVMREAGEQDVDDAIAAARLAVEDAHWRDLLPHQRADYLYRIARGLADNVERIAFIQSRDTGKTLKETRALAMSAASTFRYFAAALETMEEAITPARGPWMTLSRFEPIGVVAAITPWNSPIASDAQKVAPALAAGNAVILKPATWSPLVGLEFARIVAEAGLPPGLLSVLPGGGHTVGDRLVSDPAIGRISFTGGTKVGHAIAEKAARRLVPVSLELGGKSPTIVLPDADLDQALAGILYGMFSSSGQSCIAGSRLFIHSSIYDSFLERLVAATRALKVGHPFDPATQVAPLIHPTHVANVARWVDIARAEGGRVLVGGAAPDGAEYAQGNYYLPTIIDGVGNSATICREEVFGPVLVALPFETDADVIAMANDNQYGLACGVWTRDIVRALAIGRAVTTGTVWINTYKQFSISTPFGADKESGMGREKGLEGLRAYMRQKSYYIDTVHQVIPWAGITAG
ncbi:MAG: aldehyde dehydrogenase [Acetobacter sp.]|uniref:aldehyde dehydrogenase n=1 Tax=Acetobacter sp. TaxID=440 RepID=UPI0039E91DA0